MFHTPTEANALFSTQVYNKTLEFIADINANSIPRCIPENGTQDGNWLSGTKHNKPSAK